MRSNGFEVCEERCDQCLFSKDKIVSDSRRREILKHCSSQDAHFVCHKASIANRDVCCRGFYDAYSTNLIRISGRLGMLNFVPVPGAEMIESPPEGFYALPLAPVEKVQKGDLVWDREDEEWLPAGRNDIGQYTSCFPEVARPCAPRAVKRITRSRRP